ncbi:uncharacterized protein LOC142979605 [Anticarsia gemmatalis]|uniref:uncharacterized protein LOC142979605 n=1 Tax=Anticarsia gemmatalis TaxID=129554 RepID=UPI003F778054
MSKINKYRKRDHTTGLSGQLYETKVLTLILFRALNHKNIQEFVLGTNIDGVGAFDDIVLSYKTNDSDKHRALFIQVKHKDHPTKDKLTIDIHLQKYFDSYLKIKHKFITDNDDVIFKHSMENMQCEFIIFTSAEENFSKKTFIQESREANLIKTNDNAKIFQYNYDDKDVDSLISTLVKTRAILLAKSLLKFIVKDNFHNIMSDDLIKIYHVYLAQYIFDIETLQNNSTVPYRKTKFRQSFLDSTEESFVAMKHVINDELVKIGNKKERGKILDIENLSWKLPPNFGNPAFCFGGNEIRQQRRLNYVCSLLEKLFQRVQSDCSTLNVIKLDDNSVVDGTIEMKELETRLAGLVGNLLVYDDETGTLKFNTNEESLSTDNIRLLRRLTDKYDLSRFRFDININTFPKLSLYNKEHDRELVKEFLGKLTFYTNQATEDEVETIIKTEIQNISNDDTFNDSLVRYQSEAIFLKVHDKVQKWWKQRDSAPYLTKDCQFYQQAEREILGSPLLNVVHFMNIEKNKILEFESDVIKNLFEMQCNSLGFDWFLKSDKRTIIVISNHIDWSVKKIWIL